MNAKPLRQRRRRGRPHEAEGLVLRLITALKQICTTSQYQKTRSAHVRTSREGRRARCDPRPVPRRGEEGPIFTQFREMGEKLQDWDRGGRVRSVPAFLLHGGVPVKACMAMVDKFQTDRTERVMIISLKAGGTGLNLSRQASAVVHHDLCGSGQSKREATDPPTASGQRRDVLVYASSPRGRSKDDQRDAREARRRADLTVNIFGRDLDQISRGTEIREICRLEDQQPDAAPDTTAPFGTLRCAGRFGLGRRSAEAERGSVPY